MNTLRKCTVHCLEVLSYDILKYIGVYLTMHRDSSHIIHDFSRTIFSVPAGVMIGENDKKVVLLPIRTLANLLKMDKKRLLQ